MYIPVYTTIHDNRPASAQPDNSKKGGRAPRAIEGRAPYAIGVAPRAPRKAHSAPRAVASRAVRDFTALRAPRVVREGARRARARAAIPQRG